MPANSILSGLLSVIVPVRNEAENIPIFCNRIKKVLDKNHIDWEVIFVEDSSTDNTVEEITKAAAEDNRYKAIFLTRSFGTQEAFTAGITYSSGDHIITMDGDLQHPPEVIPELIKCYSRKRYDVVYAKRTTKESFLKDISSKLVNRTMNILSDYSIDLNTSTFRIFSRRIADTLLKMKEQNPILPGMMAWTGFKGTYILFREDRRKFGKTKFSFSRMFLMALKALTSFSTKPLRAGIFFGFFSSLVSFLFAGYYVGNYFISGITIPGFTANIVATFFIGGLILFFMGIIGEYISSIFIDIKKRPLFLVEKTLNFKKKGDEE